MWVFWLGLMILFIVLELITVGLTCIWFAAGSAAAAIVSLVGAGFIAQAIVFLLISAVLVVLTRPFARKYINSRHEKTNYEKMTGEIVQITEDVDNYAQTGRAVYNRMDWTVRSADDGVKIPAGSLARVKEISGVKLIVTPFEEPKNGEEEQKSAPQI